MRFLPFLWFLFIACDQHDAIRKEIEAMPVSFEVIRYDKSFVDTSSKDLQRLKDSFPYLFPKQYTDSVWIAKLDSPLLDSLAIETVTTFEDFDPYKEQIASLYRHLCSYLEICKTPDILTVISEVDYKNKILSNDSLIVIGLDSYLGIDHKYYEGIYDYLKVGMQSSQIIVDVCDHILNKIVPPPSHDNFINTLVYEGKKLYLKNLLLPDVSEAQKLNYTQPQIQWALKNESYVWEYFINKELIYDTDDNLLRRFIEKGPYSKFYLAIDNKTPPRIGQYIGWQIVNQYMEIHQRMPKKMLSMDNEELFILSKYKPNK